MRVRSSEKDWKIGLIHARKRPSPWWRNATGTGELLEPVVSYGRAHGVTIVPFVSEYEPELVDFVYEGYDGYIVNPATFTLGGEALRSSLIAIDRPFIEIHAHNLSKWLAERPARAAMTLESNFTHPATGVVMGFGLYSYYAAVISMIGVLDCPDFMG